MKLQTLTILSVIFIGFVYAFTQDPKRSEKGETSSFFNIYSAGLLVMASAGFLLTRSSNGGNKEHKIQEQFKQTIRQSLNKSQFVPKVLTGEEIQDGSRYDVVIVGAGIAGCALGKQLAEQGKNVLLLERDLAEPDRIVGELLQPGGVQRLQELGMQECLNDIDAQPAFGYAVYPSPTEGIVMDFPIYGNPTQPYGVAFHHGRFIQNLRQSAKKAGAHLVEGTATETIKEGNRVVGVTVKSKKSGQNIKVFGHLTIIVDGCFSAFRKELCDSPSPVSTSKFYGLILNCQLPNPGYGHVILTHPGFLLAYTIGTNETRVLIDITNNEVPENANLQEYFMEAFYPKLPTVLQQPFKVAVEAGKVRSMPNTTLHPTPMKYSGVLVMGDAWNMRLPLTGGGMTVAFGDVLVVSKLLKSITDLSKIQQLDSTLKNFYSERLGTSRPINMLAYSLYCVLRGADAMRAMCDGCIAYFRLGPKATDTPMALLGGLEPSAGALVYHYTAVALYSIWNQLYPFPTPKALLTAVNMTIAATQVLLSSKNEMFACHSRV